MATVDSIYEKLRANATYANVSDENLYDIAYDLYKMNSYKALDLYFQGLVDPYAYSAFSGENKFWAAFTYVELIQMEEAGVLIPDVVLDWAHSMQDADTTNYEASESESEEGLDSATDESQLITLRKIAKTLTSECNNNETEINQKLENLDILKKNSENTQKTADELQKSALNKVQDILTEWKNLEAKVKRGEVLSETEQSRYEELGGLLNQQNKQYQKDASSINIDFDEIAASLNEIDAMSDDTAGTAMETQAVGMKLADTEKNHKYVATVKNSTGNKDVVTGSAVSKNLAQTALETGEYTEDFAMDVQVTVNEVASIMQITEEVTSDVKQQPKSEISDSAAAGVANAAIEGAENEIEQTQNEQQEQTQKEIPAATSATQTHSGFTVGTTSPAPAAGVVASTTVEEPASTEPSVETDTLATDNSEESGNDLKTQTQEQIEACNARSNEITSAVNQLDPIKKQVEDIQKESAVQSQAVDAKIAKSVKEYEQLCDKMKNGEELSTAEETTFKKLHTELDNENGKYVKGLDEKITTLNNYKSSLDSAFNIVNTGFEIANAAIETGKQLAVQELGDRSFLMKNFFFNLMDDARQKDLLYGKAGESLGRDAIDRGEILNQEATDANTSLSRQIPLSKFAQEEAGKIGSKKTAFVDRINEITDNVPGVDPNAQTQTADNDGQEDSENSENSKQDNSEDYTDDSVKELTNKANSANKEAEQKGKDADKADKQAQKDTKEAEAAHSKFTILNAQEKAQKEETENKVEVLNEQIAAENQKLELALANAASGENLDANGMPKEASEAINVIQLYNTEIITLLGDSEKATQRLRRSKINAGVKLNTAQKSNTNAQEKCSKFEEFINDTDKFMSYVIVAGVGLELVGMYMINEGYALLNNPMTASLGLALITAGTISFNIGVTGEVAGTIGSLTCKVVKTAIAIAEGDIMGALKQIAIASATIALGPSPLGMIAVSALNIYDTNTDDRYQRDGEDNSNKKSSKSPIGKTKVIGNENIVGEDGLSTAQRKAASGNTSDNSSTGNSIITNNASDNNSSDDNQNPSQGQNNMSASLSEDSTVDDVKAQQDAKIEEINGKSWPQRAKTYITLNKEIQPKINNGIDSLTDSASDNDKLKLNKQLDEGELYANEAIKAANEVPNKLFKNIADEARTQGDKTLDAVEKGNKATGRSNIEDPTEDKKAKTGEKTNQEDEINAKNGKQAASDSKKDSSDTQKGSRSSEEDEKEMESVDKDAQKTDKKLQKDSKTLDKEIKSDQKSLQKNEEQVQKISKKIDDESTAIELAQSEVEALTTADEMNGVGGNAEEEPAPQPAVQPQPQQAQDGGAQNSGFNVMNNVMAAGAAATAAPVQTGMAASGAADSEGNASEIETLNNQIQLRSTKLGLYSGKLTKLQTKSDRIVRKMNIKQKKLDKTAKKEEKDKKEKDKLSNKVLKVAEKFEAISSNVATVGSIVGLTGDILSKVVAPPWIPAIGAVMSVVGHFAEEVGNYGVMAANLTKTAVFAAQGNLKGALMSAAVAVMAAYSAKSAGKAASDGVKNLGKNIAAAQGKAAALSAAKEGAKAVITGVGEEAVKQSMQKTAAAATVQLIKNQSKQALTQTLKQAGKTVLMNAANYYNTGSDLFGGGGNNQKKKQFSYTASERFQKLQRKNAKRRKDISKTYGLNGATATKKKNA